MKPAYVVGHITVRDEDLWSEYRARVPETLAPWGGVLVFRATRLAVLSGTEPHPDIVVIRFPDAAAVDGWFSSPAYQSLIPLRERAADMVLTSYET